MKNEAVGEYHALVLLQLNRKIEAMRKELQSGKNPWLLKYSKTINPGDYWRKVKKLGQGKYRCDAKRSLSVQFG